MDDSVIHNAVTFGNVVMGVLTVILSLAIGLRFYRAKTRARSDRGRKLNSGLMWQLVGEAVIGAGTLLFTVAAFAGWHAQWSIYTQSAIRFIMFFATSSTTIHLLWKIKQIEGE